MRECLGWMTNCPNHQGCPQNWLERSVSEIPVEVSCHVCGRQVFLVATEDQFQSKAEITELSAYPVVPCVSIPSADGVPASPRAKSLVGPPPIAQAVSSRSWQLYLNDGEVIKVDKDTMIIGRSRTCDVVINSAKISRQHASLNRVDGDLFIEDLGSANGVWCGGEKVSRAKIKPGETYNISDESLTFETM